VCEFRLVSAVPHPTAATHGPRHVPSSESVPPLPRPSPPPPQPGNNPSKSKATWVWPAQPLPPLHGSLITCRQVGRVSVCLPVACVRARAPTCLLYPPSCSWPSRSCVPTIEPVLPPHRGDVVVSLSLPRSRKPHNARVPLPFACPGSVAPPLPCPASVGVPLPTPLQRGWRPLPHGHAVVSPLPQAVRVCWRRIPASG